MVRLNHVSDRLSTFFVCSVDVIVFNKIAGKTPSLSDHAVLFLFTRSYFAVFIIIVIKGFSPLQPCIIKVNDVMDTADMLYIFMEP